MPSRKLSPLSPAEKMKMFVWDTGTTGKNPERDAIRALAVVEYSSPTKFVTRFSSSVRPRDVSMVETYDPTLPSFLLAWEQFQLFIHKHSCERQPLLVSHNAAFDLSFLQAELAREELLIPSNWHFGCSLQLARAVIADPWSLSQSSLAAQLGVVVDREHYAEEDVLVLRNILIAIDEQFCRNSSTENSTLPSSCHGLSSLYDSGSLCNTDLTELQRSEFSGTSKGVGSRAITCSCVQQIMSGAEKFQPLPLTFAKKKTFSTPCPAASSAITDLPKRTTPPNEVQYFITNSGSKFHVDGCKWLRKSRIPVDSPPSALRPCGTCLPHGCRRRGFESAKQGGSPVQSESRSQTAKVFYITRTGKKYHCEGCKWIIRSMIPRSYPPPGYGPCGTCRPDRGMREHMHKSAADRGSSHSPTSITDARSSRFYVTKHEKKYHIEGCKALRGSKILMGHLHSGYAPCLVCIGGRSSTGEKEKCLSHAVPQDGSEEKMSFYLTKTGKKFHIDGCRSLRSSKIRCDLPPAGYAPCGICLAFGFKKHGGAASCSETVESMKLKLSTFPTER